jgi:hypothetical protein
MTINDSMSLVVFYLSIDSALSDFRNVIYVLIKSYPTHAPQSLSINPPTPVPFTPSPAQELDICDQEASDASDFVIYKQIGPVLIKNDLDEAKDTISKRLEFITGEM